MKESYIDEKKEGQIEQLLKSNEENIEEESSEKIKEIDAFGIIEKNKQTKK